MILRKPYAFLIKYFRQIHLLLLFLCSFLFYKSITLQTFVKDFIATQSYNASLESIHHYINFSTYFCFFLTFLILVILMFLLHYKKKPWKVYFFVFLEYFSLLCVFLYISSFFHNYDVYSKMTTIMAGRDLLFLTTLPQYFVFVLLAIRFLGINLKQFGFQQDQEYLALSEEDREEVEVSLTFDKEDVTRGIRKFFRQLKYVYLEHRFLFHFLFLLIVVGFSSYLYYYFGVVHKIYREGDVVEANHYTIKVEHSYLTERNTNGDLISTDSSYAYVVVDLIMTNHGSDRVINIDRFRLMNRDQEAKNTLKYNQYFEDLGDGYVAKIVPSLQSSHFILVFPVDKTLDSSHYILYYQDLDENLSIKKIRLDVNDVREVETVLESHLSEEVVFPTSDHLAITKANISDYAFYTSYRCKDDGCGIVDEIVSVPNKKILELQFISDSFDGNGFVDFSSKYAKIKYKNIEGQEVLLDIESAVLKDYYGQQVFFVLPSDILYDSEFELIFVFRNQRYIYHLN